MKAPVLALSAALVLGGCADTVSGSTVRLLVLDGNLRRLGDPRNGAGPFRYAHADAGYVVEDSAGAEVFRVIDRQEGLPIGPDGEVTVS